MKRIRNGMKVVVCDGSGLDSGRKGIVLNPLGYSQDFIKRNEPGRYHPFDNRTECLIQDSNGKIFTMFNNRLNVIE